MDTKALYDSFVIPVPDDLVARYIKPRYQSQDGLLVVR